MISIEDFTRLDIRIGEIVRVEHLENPRHTTHKLTIDFGQEIGTRQSCARVTNYADNELVGRRVIALINIPPRQIGRAMSEALTLGVPDANGECVLLSPDREVPLGGKLY